jgi:hypothetical protein
MWTRVSVAVLVLGISSAGCQSEVPSVSACDPLEADTSAVVLGSVVGAGESADGTIYVVDRGGGELRAFISEEGELYRQRVSGTGEGTNADGEFVLVSLNELDPTASLMVTTDSDGNSRMGVAFGPIATKTFVIGEQGEELTLLPDGDVKALPVRNYAAEIEIEYSAELTDGRALVVLRPRDFNDYSEFRVFFGPVDRLEERELTSAARQRDGGSTDLEFEVDGQPAHAFFPVESTEDGFMPGEPELTIDGDSVALSLTTPAQSPADASYYCIE